MICRIWRKIKSVAMDIWCVALILTVGAIFCLIAEYNWWVDKLKRKK
jgi:hypothetical protein